jgi:hypothetical protein
VSTCVAKTLSPLWYTASRCFGATISPETPPGRSVSCSLRSAFKLTTKSCRPLDVEPEKTISSPSPSARERKELLWK